MAEQLCKLFKDNIADIVPDVKIRDVMKRNLNSMNTKNITDSQFFDEVRNSLKIPIYKIAIEENEEKKLDSYEYFHLEANKWKTTDIKELLKHETCILLVLKGSNFDHVATFTSDWTNDLRIELFLKSDDAIMVQIGIDLLMKNSKSPKLRYMCENFNVFSENSYGKKLFQVLYETNRNDTIEFILQNECCFPSNPNEQQIPLVQIRLKSNNNFHELIKTGNQKEIEKFLRATPNQRYINNEDNESACAVAIKMKNYQLYSFLYQKNLTVRNYESKLLKHEDFLCFFRNQSLPHEEYSEKVLQTLTSATSIVNVKKTNLNLYEIYKQLIQIPKFELVLNIIYKLTPISIIVDCQEENNSKMCSYECGTTRGLYDSHRQLNRIYIFGGGGTEQMLGTFAHDFTHFAMNLLYKNYAEPYQSNDDERKKDYTKIVEVICQKVKDGHVNEEVIQQIYNPINSKFKSHTELIVCVNHILAFYGNKRGTRILIEEAPELFKFYTDKIVPDLAKYLSTQVNRNDRLYYSVFIQGLERKCQEYRFKPNNFLALVTQTPGHVMIETNCVYLTCIKLFSNITATENKDYNLNNTFMIDLQTLSTNIELDSFAYFQKYELLIVVDEAVENQSDVNAWTNINDYVNTSGKRLICVIEKEQTLPFQTTKYEDICQWTDFDEKSRKLILNKLEVNFQGNKIKFSELIDYEDNSNILNKILSIDMIRDCMFGQSLLSTTVGTTLFKNSTYYIERKLKTTLFELDELTDDITIKYVCENITDQSNEKLFELETNDGILITFPGKKLRKIWEASGSFSSVESSVQNSTEMAAVYDVIKTDIYILSSSNCAATSIFIDGNKEIQMNDFSYSDLLTLSENNSQFNIHWFLESETRPYFYHRLKTFGLADKLKYLHYRENYTLDEWKLFEKLAHQKISLIAATAGMGKTETMKSLAQRLVRNNPSTWAPVVILIKNTKLLKEFNADKANLDNIFDFLVEFLQLKSNLEKELFKHCCTKKNSNVYLFLDGTAEISPTYTEEIYKIIEILSKTNIKHITVSARLNSKSDFENRLNTVAISMEPLLYGDQVRVMKNIWKCKQLDNIKKISRRVTKYFREFDDILNNPIQIELVARICGNKLAEFSQNILNIGHFFVNSTRMEIYAKLVDQKLTMTIEETFGWDLSTPVNFQAAKYYVENTKQVKYAAIITLLDEQKVKLFLSLSDIEANKKFAKKVKNLNTYDGIVDGIVSGKLHFVHRTFTEYLFADFLINDWKHWSMKEWEYFFFDDVLVKKQFQYVRTFFNSYKGRIQNLSIKPTHYQIPVTLHDAVVQNIEENNTEILKHLHALGFNLTINLSTLISKYINNETLSSIIKLIDTITVLVKHCDTVYIPFNELRYIDFQTLCQIFPYDCNNLIRMLLKCKIIDLSDDKLRQKQTNVFLSSWNQAQDKTEAMTDDELKKLFELFKKEEKEKEEKETDSIM